MMIEPRIVTTDENGFLDGPIYSWIALQRVSHKDIIDRAQNLNRDCHHFLANCAVDLGNGKQITASVLFARIVELYQSIILSSERGMAAATRVLFRTFLEACFHFFAIQKDDKYLNDYVNQALLQKRKLLNRMRRSKSSLLESFRIEATDQLLADTEKAIADAGAREITIEETATRAEMLETYFTAYAVLSYAVHTGASDIEDHILVNDVTKDIEGFTYGPSEVETRRAICLSGMTLAEALKFVSMDFGEDRKALCTAHTEAFQSFLEKA
jgi:hypothetical protein